MAGEEGNSTRNYVLKFEGLCCLLRLAKTSFHRHTFERKVI